MIEIGVIGGTGLYSIEGMEILEKKKVETPFGGPSAEVSIGRLGSREIAFLPRHGSGHTILPSEINYRANLWALKSVGARAVMSVSATGSLVKEIAPGDLALVNQYFDWTKGKRVSSFFGEGIAAHISTAQPACPLLSDAVASAASRAGVSLHTGKTYACVEGPRLGTRAESFFLKNAVKADLVGMTNVPEAFLALEAQLSYCTIAVCTDYDCWLDDPEEHVTVDLVMKRYQSSLEKVKKVLGEVLSGDLKLSESPSRKSLETAVLTPLENLTPKTREVLDFLRQ